MAENDTTIVYRLDQENQIISVDGPWDDFALDNEGSNAIACQVEGRPIWHFITGDTTRMWFEVMLKSARLRQTTLELCYRCDSPELKRFMRMRIVPGENDILSIEHEQIGEERRASPVTIRYAGNKPVGSFNTRCSMCGRLKQGPDWLEPEQQKHPSDTVNVIYTVCESCKTLVSKASAAS